MLPSFRTTAISLRSLSVVACAGCRHKEATKADASDQSCADLAALGVADRSPGGSTQPDRGPGWLAGALSPEMASKNLGLAIAAESLAQKEELPEELGSFILTGDEGLTKAVASPERKSALTAAKAAYAKAWAEGGELFVLANEGAPGNIFGTVALWKCGRSLPLYVHPYRQVEGFTVSPDRNWLAVVHVGDRQYSGAIVPLYLKDSEIVLVNLRTFEQQRITAPEALSVQSIALGWDASSQLRIRLKDTWNTSGDSRSYATCDPRQPTCALTAPKDGTTHPTFPRDALEVTSLSAYRLGDAPGGFKAPANLVPRTLRASPDGKWVAYLTSDDDADELLPATIHLFVASVGENAKPLELQRGDELFHFAWQPDGTLAYELPASPSPKLAAAMDEVRKDPEFGAAVSDILGSDSQHSPEEVKRMTDYLAPEFAVRAMNPEQRAEGLYFSSQVARFDPVKGEKLPYHPGEFVRLYSGAGGPTHHHKGPVHEVPADR